ncbi:MAG: ATP-binding protein [Coriobacteriaceae bacterium]|nr:ATP-binding protein [Coriobacteriaceae bacterium]
MAHSKNTLSHRVFSTIFVAAVVVIAVFTLAGVAYLQTNLSSQVFDELHDETHVVAAALNQTNSTKALLEQIDLGDTRVTLVSKRGEVLFDTEEDPFEMGNHATRPEIADALRNGEGKAQRASSTIGRSMIYEAVRLDNGNVIRLAKSQEGYLAIFGNMIVPLLILGACVAVLAWMAAKREAQNIIAPLLLVDLDHPQRSCDNAYDEMVPMLERLEKQRQELKRQVRVLADNDRMRREFTANITHELKTPLTAISGYAELIASGMVEAEDDQRDFARRIHDEAGRLTSLVNDILTLSNLDEAEHGATEGSAEILGTREPVDLPRMVQSVCQRLETVASSADVVISSDTAPSLVQGVPRLLDEMTYNLASNAIRYNRPEGSVVVSCGVNDQGQPFIRVEDTGIGIAPEEQDKIFERFYRVDKSRSKARGGTGLGLAIVKHAAVFHGATISLKSRVGEGTCITVTFPSDLACSVSA